MKTTTLQTGRRRDAPADCLAPAEADAQRMFGDGPARMWRPSPRWGKWVAWAAAGAVVAGGWWIWRADVRVDAPVGAAAIGAAPEVTVHEPAPRATRMVPESKPVDASICVGRGCGIDPLATPIAEGVAAAQVDPDAWALHPEPVRMAAVPGFTGLVNVPDVPDENDATPGEETVEEDAAGASRADVQSGDARQAD